jgi:Na+/serine symporter
VNDNEQKERNLSVSAEYHVDTQIGLLGEKYSLALARNFAINAQNSAITILMLYLTNVNSHDFSLHFDTFFSS